MFQRKPRRFRRRPNNRSHISHVSGNPKNRLGSSSFTNGHTRNNFRPYLSAEKLLEKYNLPTKLKIPNKLNRKIHSGIYEGVFLDKKIKNKYPRFISLKKIYSPKIEEIKDFGALNDSIYKIIQN